MLEPDELPDELQQLEDELSQPASGDLPAELRMRVMKSVRAAKRSETVQKIPHGKGLMAIGGFATVAVVLIVMLLLQGGSPIPKPPGERTLTMSADDQAEPIMLPTIQAYRISLDAAPDQWETLIANRADAFALRPHNSTDVLEWSDQSTLLNERD